jgi:Ca2+-binding RTX toxin-like protein
MANLYSEKSLNFEDYYLELHTLVKNCIDFEFSQDQNVVYRGITYPDGFSFLTAVHDAHYRWLFGGSKLRFDSQGNAIAGTVTGVAVYDYDLGAEAVRDSRVGIENIKVPLKSLTDAALTASVDDDEVIWSRLLSGADLMTLSDDDDVVVGFGGNDSIYGNGGDDYLGGGDGNDLIVGGAGNDVVDGEKGQDTLTGGIGDDIFYFDAPISKKMLDTVTDFDSLADTLVFDTSIFKSLSEGELAADQFVQGARALDTNDFFIYNNGTLFYDADGNGKTKAVAVVTLTGLPTLTHEDIYCELN